MPGRSYSFNDRAACPLLLYAIACALLLLVCGTAPAQPDGTQWPTRQAVDRVEQLDALNHPAVPLVSLEAASEESPEQDTVELSESTDDDKHEQCLLIIRRFNGADVENPTGLYVSAAERAAIPFALRAYPSRGSPTA